MNFQKNLIFRYLCTDQEGDLGAVHEPLLGPQHLATACSACPPPPAPGGSPALTPGKLLPPAIRSLGQGPLEHVSENVVFCVYYNRLTSELERPLKLRLYSIPIHFLSDNDIKDRHAGKCYFIVRNRGNTCLEFVDNSRGLCK